MVLLPLLNAAYDWLSIGVTRVLLTQTLRQEGRGAFKRSLLDFALAVLSLVLLALSVTGFLQLLNQLAVSGGGKEVYDLAGLLTKLRHTPYDPSVWWIYFTLFSTLLPTLVHAFVGIWSFLGWTWPQAKRGTIYRGYRQLQRDRSR